jgi:hypothetical protein
MRPSDFNELAGKRFLRAAADRLIEAITAEFGAR